MTDRYATRRRHHCEYPECLHFSRIGSPFCRAHRDTVIAPEHREPVALPYWQRIQNAEQERANALREEFRRRVESGDYATLYTPTIAALIEAAAKEKGLDTEIGALRVVLAEVVSTIDDPAEKARVAATVTRAIALVSRTQSAADSGLVAGLQELIYGVLGDLDGER